MIDDLAGYTPHLSRLVHLLEYVRHNTLWTVRDLSTEQLDEQLFPDGNTIGMLLAHIAGIEESYQGVTFRRQRPTGDAPEHVLGELGRTTFRGYPLDFYLERLARVRVETLRQLQQKDDEWLHTTFQPWNSTDWNNYFCWFHVAEDEIRHQGQMAVFRKEIERRSGQVSRNTTL